MTLARSEPLQVQVNVPQTGGESPLCHQKIGERLDAAAGTSLGGFVVAHGGMIDIDQFVIRPVLLLGSMGGGRDISCSRCQQRHLCVVISLR